MSKRVVLCLLLSIIILPLDLQAAPPAQENIQAVIVSPRDNAVVLGMVSIMGSAVHPDFWKYEIAYAPEASGDDQWVMIGPEHTNQVSNDLLETWNTEAVPDSVYKLRLRVVDQTGNYQEYIVHNISVVNTQPTATPTVPRPADTPTPGTPTATPTPLPPTPTISVEQPVLPTNTPKPTDTPAPTRAPTRPPIVVAPTAVDPRGLGGAFCYGAAITAAVFLFFGLLSLLRWAVLSLVSRYR